MKENDIFYENDNWDEKADWCNESGKYHIEEIEPDENGRRFKIVKNPEPTAEQQKINRIAELKEQIAKYKEDVEQVELFGMERADYEDKKAQCVQIIEELRILERQLKGE